MSELETELRRYIAHRADQVSENHAGLIVTRALARTDERRSWTRHGLNAALALAAALFLIAVGLLPSQLRNLRTTPVPSGARLPAIPNEIVDLDANPDMVIPFDLKTGKTLAPRYRWILPGNRALYLATPSDCGNTLVYVMDRATNHQLQGPVSLPDCYGSPVVLPGTSVLLRHWTLKSRTPPQAQDLGLVTYDWSAGRIVKTYPSLLLGFGTAVALTDGTRLYNFDPFADAPALDIIDLGSGASIAHVPIALDSTGLNPGGIVLSPDGRTLYLNRGDLVLAFDARTGAALASFDFKQSGVTSWRLPSWLAPIDADAKEGFEPSHGIAIDPRGRFIAALAADDVGISGLWIFNLSTVPHPTRHISMGARGIAFSRDGTVLYVLDTGGTLNAFDPVTGRNIKRYSVGDFFGIAGIEAN